MHAGSEDEEAGYFGTELSVSLQAQMRNENGDFTSGKHLFPKRNVFFDTNGCAFWN